MFTSLRPSGVQYHIHPPSHSERSWSCYHHSRGSTFANVPDTQPAYGMHNGSPPCLGLGGELSVAPSLGSSQ